ncbi:GNAT family N-acetyltransferase [uncultured Kordia sp.]|uniref:GNAT family N-acetyltransferase n=1 Tax=uncultured Kordia sp. TaxID=507699 RepID=UPI002621916D|nr:GNAT family N-acetyltransferase [uncultured Kordia sp.]
MKKVLETERTYLRELSIADAESFYNLNLDKEVIRYTGDVVFESINHAKKFLENYDQYQKYGVGRWAVIHKETNDFLGWCGLKYSSSSDEYDIGFRFFRKYWNLGYATETAKACIEYGFHTMQVKSIVGRAMKANIASIKVLEKIGLSYKCDFDFDGSAGVIYTITAIF